MVFDFTDAFPYTPPSGGAILFAFGNPAIAIDHQIKLGLDVDQTFVKSFSIDQNLKLGLSLEQNFYKSYPGFGPAISLFEEDLNIRQISLTFDQLGRPLVFYSTDLLELKLYWYNPVVGANVIEVISTGQDPLACFDFPQDTGQPFTDVLIFYVRNDRIYMRIQRDRFQSEYYTGVTYPGVRLESAGLRVDNRLQLVYNYPGDTFR